MNSNILIVLLKYLSGLCENVITDLNNSLKVQLVKTSLMLQTMMISPFTNDAVLGCVYSHTDQTTQCDSSSP